MISNEDLLTLPSRRLLRSFTGNTTTEVGVTSLIRHRCRMELETLEEEDKLVSLQLDEMQLREALTFDKNNDTVIGHVDLGNVGRRNGEFYSEFESTHADIHEDESEGKSLSDKPLANKLLCFVISGIRKRFKFPVGYYFVNSLTGEELWHLTMEVIKEMEDIGFKIFRIVADNARTNAYLFKKLSGDPQQGVVAVHPLDNTREIFCCNDYCHVIKCIRNLWLTRDFLIEGNLVSFSYLKSLYRIQKESLLKPVRYLSLKHVNPNTFERQKVVWAVSIFRPEVTAALRLLRDLGYEEFKGVDETIRFMEIIHKWWCLNDVSNTVQGIHQRDPNRLAYYDVDDPRFDWLINFFIPYLRKWKANVIDKKQFLSEETYDATLRVTLSMVYGTKKLLENGQKFVLTRRFNSDDVESTFGAIRQVHGGNDRPTAEKASQAINRLLRTGIKCVIALIQLIND